MCLDGGEAELASCCTPGTALHVARVARHVLAQQRQHRRPVSERHLHSAQDHNCEALPRRVHCRVLSAHVTPHLSALLDQEQTRQAEPRPELHHSSPRPHQRLLRPCSSQAVTALDAYQNVLHQRLYRRDVRTQEAGQNKGGVPQACAHADAALMQSLRLQHCGACHESSAGSVGVAPHVHRSPESAAVTCCCILMVMPAVLTVTWLEAWTAHLSNLDSVFRKGTPSSHLQGTGCHPVCSGDAHVHKAHVDHLSHPSSSMSMLITFPSLSAPTCHRCFVAIEEILAAP